MQAARRPAAAWSSTDGLGNLPAANPPALQPLMRRLYPPGYGPLSDLPPTGPSPVLMRAADWVRVAPRWERYTAQVRDGVGRGRVGGWQAHARGAGNR